MKYAELITDRLSADVSLISEVMLLSCSGLATILFPKCARVKLQFIIIKT
jgi:hypothetical protein